MIPLGDSPNPRGVPFVNYTLIAVNVAIFILISFPLTVMPVDRADPLLPEYLQLVMQNLRQPASVESLLDSMSAYDLFVYRWGFRPAEPNWMSFFASMFLHGGIMHLLGNMLFLWIYGDNVEHRLGRVRYFLSYLATGAAASLGHWALNPGSAIPTVGASGAISGVLGFYFIFFPHNTVRVLLPFFPFFFQVVQLPARLILGLYLVLDNLFPLFLTAGTRGAGVAYGAHIGGFVAGLAAAWWISRREADASPRAYALPGGPRGLVRTPAEEISQAIRLGDFEHAARLYFGLPPERRRDLLPTEQSLALAEWLAEAGQSDAALAVYRRHLRDHPADETTARAHLGAGLVLLDRDEPAAAYQHVLDVLQSQPSPEVEAEARRALAEIAERHKLRLSGLGRGRGRADR